jgi:hypothetical protein
VPPATTTVDARTPHETLQDMYELVGARSELVIAGDKAGCRMGLVNDITAWGEQMPGPCPQTAAGRCNCSMCVSRCGALGLLRGLLVVAYSRPAPRASRLPLAQRLASS